MPSVLAIDQGTTGSTCLVVSKDGRIIGRGYREIPQHYPQPGWVEHDPRDLLDRTVEAAREAIAKAGTTPDAIGITNQRETVVLWERKTGEPIGRAIVWQDRRTAERCLELAPEADRIARLTGLVTDPYFSGTKLEWMLRDDSVRRRAMRGELAAGTVDSWLIWSLTRGAVHATDPTNASRTMLYDINTRAWSDELCDLLHVPRALLPGVRSSSGEFGVADPAFLGKALPIMGVAGDQQAALFGQGCHSPGTSKNTYGTGAFLLLNTGSQRAEGGGGLLTTIACDAVGRPAYALEAAIFIAGAAIQWLRDGLGILTTAAESEAAARAIASTDGVYFVPALVGMGAPHWEPRARGTIVGLTRGTTSAHLVRAALEAMAYSTADILDVMRARAGRGAGGFSAERNAPLRVDGGATENDWLMQFQADVLGVPVERPDQIETTALGAAGLAGLAAGIWPNVDAFQATRKFTRFEPGEGRETARAGAAGWARAVRATLSWARDAS
ncbi:MAG TPA: glycerol kinase GlpK [Gemmatimonadaceae bacterium]|nr:glycerol kinase GlpK [Gemmatimonadaceae bacterium]